MISDSYCEVYKPIITQKGDGNIKATPSVKRNILINEKTYRGLCQTPTTAMGKVGI